MRNVLRLAMIFLLTASILTPWQSASDGRTFSIAGQSGYAKILEVNGKSYVEVEDVARLTRGSISFSTNQVLLSLPAQSASASALPATQGFSKEFRQTGIELMSSLREWRITIVNSIQSNFPVSEEGVSELQRRAQRNLALVGSARSTQDDRSGYALLAAEFSNMRKLSDGFLSKRRQLQYIDPHSIDNDPLDRQIVACGRSIASMAAENQYRDEAACIEAR
ncbi:MAG: hypothetical protein ACJ746_06750 [Bryobacteraceae bacterium]